MIQSNYGDDMKDNRTAFVVLILNENNECCIVLYVMYSSMRTVQTGHSDIAKF